MSGFNGPIILDDTFADGTQAGEQFYSELHEGLLDNSEGFLPMAAYGKQVQGHMPEYDPSTFPGFAAPYHGQITYAPEYASVQHPEYYYNGTQFESVNLVQPVPVSYQARPAMIAQHTQDHFIPQLDEVNRNSHKRKASDSSDYSFQPPNKKASLGPLNIQSANVEYYDLSASASPYATPYTPFGAPTPTGSVGPQPIRIATASPRGHHYSTSAASQISLAAPSPATPVWSPSVTATKSEQSPRAPMTPIPRVSSAVSSKTAPALVRTSTIAQQSPHGVQAMATMTHPQGFNPYVLYPAKASLKLVGNLDDMSQGFTADEYAARRRLVQFEREQKDSIITATFKPVTPQERQPNSICINCIWWKEKDEYYVTSVDTINLLEALVGVRFTVEEKNRIRRNLEGFRPATVSKAKTGSEDFFKLIMAFPHPKPRHIEKDVKVFPWKILSMALKKIIGKYSASYSSTASALQPNAYSSAEYHNEYQLPPSPHPEPMPMMQSYAPSVAGYDPAAYHHGRASAPVTTVPMSSMSVQIPTMGALYYPTVEGHDHQMFHMNQGRMPPTMSLPLQMMGAPPHGMAHHWDFENFVHESPMTMGPSSAPVTAYPRGPIDVAEFGAPTGYGMRRN